MTLLWSDRALADLARLRSFLSVVNPAAAITTLKDLESATLRLLEYPRLGERMEEFGDREVRRILVGPYEVSYEILASTITIVRVRHTRQRR